MTDTTATAPFDMSLVQRGARNRRTPYYEATQRYGPKGFTVYNHMYFPIRFDSFEAEFEALLNDVTIWDVSVERCLEISGPDGFTFAQLLTPRDLSKCQVGQAKYVLICDSDGGIVNDPVLTRMDENTFWFALASSDALLFARGPEERLPGPRRHDPRGGRRADAGPGPEVEGPHGRASLGDSILDLKYYWWRHAEIRGIPVVVTRTGWTSEVGYEIYLTDTSQGTELWEARHGGRRAVRRPADRPVRHPADRGRHLQLGRRHDLRAQRVRDGPRAAGRLRPRRRRLHLDRRATGGSRTRASTRRIVGVELDGEPFPELNNVKWPASAAGGEGAVGEAS